METIIETFHVDIKLLLAQAINFGIVFSLLYFFALKPLSKVMKDREKTIEKSLSDAKDIENKLSKTNDDYNKVINDARKKAEEILEKASQIAEEKKNEMVVKAKEEIGQVIEQEKAQIRNDKARTLKEIKTEIADLVIMSVEKILKEKLDAKKDKELIKNILASK